MALPIREKYLRGIFDAGLIIKAADGALQVLGAGLLFFLKPQTINHIFASLTQYELLEDPRDKFANYILGFGHVTASGEWFGALFLLAHGLVNIGLVIGLLKNKLWAYPASAGVFALLAIYQIYTLTLGPDLLLELITALDVVVIVLILHEYKHRRTQRMG